MRAVGLWIVTSRGLIRRGVVAVLVFGGITGCATSAADSSTQSFEADNWPDAMATTPLEFRDALDSLDVFGECFIGQVRDDLTGSPTEVACYVVEAQDRANRADQMRGVGVYVFRPGSWPNVGDTTMCWDTDSPVVSDGATFIAMGSPGGTKYGEWPPEVWPEDVQRVLGGRVTSTNAWC